jgi:hypothetical protein
MVLTKPVLRFCAMAQEGGVALTLFERQSRWVPTNMVFGLFGSSVSGAMKSVGPPLTASVMPADSSCRRPTPRS